TSGRGRSACARAMSSSLDLSGRARLALAVCLVSSAAGLPRLGGGRRSRVARRGRPPPGGCARSHCSAAPRRPGSAGARAAALLPASLLIAVLRPTVPASGFAAAFVFFLVADTTVALVTEELAFRRALVGPPDSAGLGTLVLMALVFGLWHVVQPGYGGAPL